MTTFMVIVLVTIVAGVLSVGLMWGLLAASLTVFFGGILLIIGSIVLAALNEATKEKK